MLCFLQYFTDKERKNPKSLHLHLQLNENFKEKIGKKLKQKKVEKRTRLAWDLNPQPPK